MKSGFKKAPKNINRHVTRHEEWTPQNFEIAHRDGQPRTVEGETWRHFGVADITEPYDDIGEYITLTHLPTGMEMPCYYENCRTQRISSPDHLKIAAEAVADIIPEDRQDIEDRWSQELADRAKQAVLDIDWEAV